MSHEISGQQQDSVWSQFASHVFSSKFIRINHKALKKLCYKWVLTKGQNPEHSGSWI